LVGANHGRYLIVSRDGGAGDCIARADFTPLRTADDVSLPLADYSEPQKLAMVASKQPAGLDSALSIEAFESKIRDCALRLGRVKALVD
jgi:hypothetical protein